MKIVVAGQKAFAVAVLEELLGWHQVVAVWPDQGDSKLEGRRKSLGLPRFDTMRRGADLLVCAHMHTRVEPEVRERFRFGAIGYHPSLLPRHRGIDAVTWTIKRGDSIAGGTVYEFDDGLDTGGIVKQDWCHVREEWDASALWREALFPMGVRLLFDACRDIEDDGMVVSLPQDDTLATEAPLLEQLDQTQQRRTHA